MVGAARRDARWMATAAPLALGLLLAVGTAFGSLLWAFAVNDTTVVNVVANSHSAKPLIYKLSGSWGNHEGSMVLWVLILALCGAAVALFGRDLPTALKAEEQKETAKPKTTRSRKAPVSSKSDSKG